MGDLGRYVLVTSFRADGGDAEHGRNTFFASGSWRPAFFSNVPRASGTVKPDNELSVVDVLMRATAAPTYFPIALTDNGTYIDGAVFANNPGLCGVAKAIAHYPEVGSDNIQLLSIGSGFIERQIDHAEINKNPISGADWGIAHWAPYLLSLMHGATELNIDLTLQLLLREHHRVNYFSRVEIDMDDCQEMQKLIALADAVDLSETEAWLERCRFDDEELDIDRSWRKGPLHSPTVPRRTPKSP